MAEKRVDITWTGAHYKHNSSQFGFAGSGSQVPQAMRNYGGPPQGGFCVFVYKLTDWLLDYPCAQSYHYVCEVCLHQ